MHKEGLWSAKFIWPALGQAFIKLNPFLLWRNLVMLVVEIGAVTTSIVTIVNFLHHSSYGFDLHISIWLWITVLFANFAESLAEGKGRAQADSLKQGRSEIYAQRITPGTDEKFERE